MAEEFWGRLEFPARLIDDEVREALEREGAEFNGGRLIERRNRVYGPEIYVENGIFTLDDQEASYGMLYDLEQLLRKKGIPLDRQSGQAYDYTPELVIFRPAQNGTPALDLNLPLFNDEPFITVQELRELLPQGIQAIRAYLDKEYPTYPPLGDYVTVHNFLDTVRG
jgi:hypothetical protein